MLTSIPATSFSLIKLRNMNDINTGTPDLCNSRTEEGEIASTEQISP
jgi:hypothetical protein